MDNSTSVHTASCCCQEIWHHETHLGQVGKRGKDQIRSMWNGNHLCASIPVFRHRAPFQRPPYAINATPIIIYARVSSTKQKEAGDLAHQIKQLKEYCPNYDKVIQDVPSGLNFNRRGSYVPSGRRRVWKCRKSYGHLQRQSD